MTGGVCSAVQDSEDQYYQCYIYLLTYQSVDPKSCTDGSVQSATVDQAAYKLGLYAVQVNQNHQELSLGRCVWKCVKELGILWLPV